MSTRFQKGQSGNPSGKKKGTKHDVTRYRELFKESAPELIKTIIDQALSGDMTAARICIDRIAPALKPQSDPAATPLPTTGTLEDQATAIFTATTEGKIGTDEATALMGLITAQLKIKETTQIEERLKVLEAKAEVTNDKFRK